MIIDYGNKTVGIKIVFFGPAMSGKTTAIKWLFKSLGEEVTSIENTVGRTMFMDFGVIPFSLGDTWTINAHLWSATGQDFYKSTREVVLVGADGIVFVVDAQEHLQEENLVSWKELVSTMESSRDLLPLVIFLNKTDLPNIIDETRLRSHLHIPTSIPVMQGIAKEGHNVIETFQLLFQESLKSNIH
ncbi:MAG: ATP/GTP-binding protein [Candidatus Thorarchaeota archaeon]